MTTKPEAIWVKQIDQWLERYMQELSLEYVSFCPPSTEQNFSKLEKFCGDIVASLANISALILEVKVNINGTLNSYEQPPGQREGLVELENRGLPVFYSYNVVESGEFSKKNSAGDQLQNVTAIKPSEQTSKSAITNSTNLKATVDNLLNDESGSQDASLALAYFVAPEAPIVGSGIEKITTQTLLLIYDRNSKILVSLEKGSAQLLLQQVKEHEFHAASKNSDDLSKAIENFLDFAQSLAKIEESIVAHHLTNDGRKKVRSNLNYSGKILFISPHHVLQSLGKDSFIAHERNNLSGEISTLSVGESAEIEYQGGKGLVAPPKSIDKNNFKCR